MSFIKPEVGATVALEMLKNHEADHRLHISWDTTIVKAALAQGWSPQHLSFYPGDDEKRDERIKCVSESGVEIVDTIPMGVESIGNPPYTVPGNPNIYEDLVVKAIDAAPIGGRVSSLIPRNWAMNVESDLRKRVVAEAGDSLSIRIISRPIEWKGIDTEVLILSFLKKGQRAENYFLTVPGPNPGDVDTTNERPVIDELLCLDNTLNPVVQKKASELVSQYGAIELVDPRAGGEATSVIAVPCISYKTQKQAPELRGRSDVNVIWDGGSRCTLIIEEQLKLKLNSSFESWLKEKKSEGYTDVVLYHGLLGKRDKVPLQQHLCVEKINVCRPFSVILGRALVIPVKNLEKHIWFIQHKLIVSLINAFHQGVYPAKTLAGHIPNISHLLSNDVSERETQMKEWFT